VSPAFTICPRMMAESIKNRTAAAAIAGQPISDPADLAGGA
jgi:hypothetical protein